MSVMVTPSYRVMKWLMQMNVVVMVMVLMFVDVINAIPSTPDNLRPLIDHQVWEVSGGDDGIDVLLGLAHEGEVDILGHNFNTHTIRVSPTYSDKVTTTLKKAGLTHTVTINDLAAFLQKEEYHVYKRNTGGAQVCTDTKCTQPLDQEYMTFKQMESYLKYINKKSVHATVEVIGKSVNGNGIWLAHIKPIRGREGKARVGPTQKKKAIWIEAGIHAREWISSATAMHLIHKFAGQPSLKYDIFIAPMANPDGYIYTWTNNRMWRKNRGLTRNSCVGVDLNRNWDSHWGVGASKNPCSDTFQGEAPFSQPETLALKKEMERLNKTHDIEVVLSLHSYGQVIMYPWGWTTNAAPDQSIMHSMGEVLANAIQKESGKSYRVVNSAGGFYPASGATDDWAKDKLNSKYVYTIELRDTGRSGFTLPANQIKATADEIGKAVDTMLVKLEVGN